MTRKEQQAWAIVGIEVIAIIILLLRFGNTALTNTDVTDGGITLPNYNPGTFVINQGPINNYPYIFAPPGQGSSDAFNIQAGQPCGCGCDSPGTFQLPNLTTYVNQLNASLQSNAITGIINWIGGVPPIDTNNTNIGFGGDSTGVYGF